MCLGIPIFFDCAGTLIASALGGFLPGLIVGFFSNLIISLSDPITVYYGVINVLIGLTAAAFANKGYFNRLRTALPTSIAFAVIGGGLGSLLTWALYGLNIGEGISAPLAVFYYENVGMDKFSPSFPPTL